MREFLCALVAMGALGGCIDEAALGSARLEVIDGEATPQGLFPATGAMVAQGEVMCTGTLISPTVVLTAAHCVDPLFLNGGTPSFTLASDGSDPQRILVAGDQTFQHPEFDLFSEPAEGVQVWNDIGVMTLVEPIDDVAYELLASPDEVTRSLSVDTVVDIVGYGLTEAGGEDFGVKTHGVATVIEVGTHELFIGKPGEQQNCNGDSGGPAYLEDDNGVRIVGIVSRSPDQNPVCDHGGIDTRVDPYIDWIVSVAPQLCVELDCGDVGIPRPPGYWSDDEADPDPEEEPTPGGGSDGGCAASGSAGGSWSLVVFPLVLLRRRRRRR